MAEPHHIAAAHAAFDAQGYNPASSIHDDCNKGPWIDTYASVNAMFERGDRDRLRRETAEAERDIKALMAAHHECRRGMGL